MTCRRQRMYRCAFAVVALSLMLAGSALAQERSIWKIGEFDNSSAEFGNQPTSDLFVISKNQAGDWPSTQRAVAANNAASATPLRVRFQLPNAPRGVFTLRVGLLVLTPRLPVLQIDVNGHRGWFYQRPEIDNREGNVEGSIFPQYSIGTRRMEIPAEFLQQGENEISLLALNDPLTAALPGGEDLSDSFLTFDAVALENSARAATESAVTAEATPTVFFKREAGQMSEVVSVLVNWRRLTPRGTVTLLVGAWRSTQPFACEREFGEQRLEFLVPEFTAGTQSRIDVKLNAQNFRYTQSLRPAKKWTIFLVPHQHLDVGYSDFQTKLAELHSRVIDEAMQMSEEH